MKYVSSQGERSGTNGQLSDMTVGRSRGADSLHGGRGGGAAPGPGVHQQYSKRALSVLLQMWRVHVAYETMH